MLFSFLSFFSCPRGRLRCHVFISVIFFLVIIRSTTLVLPLNDSSTAYTRLHFLVHNKAILDAFNDHSFLLSFSSLFAFLPKKTDMESMYVFISVLFILPDKHDNPSMQLWTLDETSIGRSHYTSHFRILVQKVVGRLLLTELLRALTHFSKRDQSRNHACLHASGMYQGLPAIYIHVFWLVLTLHMFSSLSSDQISVEIVFPFDLSATYSQIFARVPGNSLALKCADNSAID